jgi:CDP-diacylglycerol--serine O-phosphatidyltransferase
MVTLGNLLCGFGAISLSLRAWNAPGGLAAPDCLYWSGMLIFAAMIFDVLDGSIARWTKTSSRFGLEMDSLADVVSFGVAPAVLAKASIDTLSQLPGDLRPGQAYPLLDRYVWPMLATYVACAALRLARYNVEAEKGHQAFFFGLPSPAAAGCVASLIVLIYPAKTQLPHISGHKDVQSLLDWLPKSPEFLYAVLVALPALMLCLGVLMVSRVRYIHVGDRFLGRKRSLLSFLVPMLFVVLLVMQPEIMLVLVFNGFMLLGLVNEVRYQLFPAQSPPGMLSSAENQAKDDATGQPGPTIPQAPPKDIPPV